MAAESSATSTGTGTNPEADFDLEEFLHHIENLVEDGGELKRRKGKLLGHDHLSV